MLNARSSLLVALLAAGFAYQPSGSKAPSRAGEPNQQPQTAANRTVTYDKQLEIRNWPLDAIRQSFGRGPEADRRLAAAEIKFIIATAPDPQNSHYPLVFDRLMQSMQRGLADSRYTLDCFWMPWDSEAGPVDVDFVMHQQHQDWFERKQAQPGMVMFRRAGGSTDRVCLLIVGETPEIGINRSQFTNAIQIIDQLSRSREISILGPTFSGAIYSLGAAISAVQQGQADRYTFDVVTGTATAPDNETRLKEAAQGASVHFTRLIGTDDAAVNVFLKYATRKVSCDQIAFLTESGTTYAGGIETGMETCARITNFHYPMQISRMRNAYGSDADLQALSVTKIGNAPRQGLAIPLKDEHEGQDLVPVYSHELLPVSQEVSILNVLATVAYSRITNIGIVATDVLDALFLGRLLKEHCPNVRPFILDSDLLFGHSSQNNAFDGMLVISSYPLIRKSRWIQGANSGQQPDSPQFSSATEEGEYWATLRLLSRMSGSHDFAKPPSTSPSIAVMGRDGIWPIQDPDFPNLRSVPYTSLGWKLFFALTSLFCLTFAGAAIYFNTNVEDHHVPLGWLAAMRASTTDARIVLSLGCLLLATAYSFVVLIEMRITVEPVSIGSFVGVVTFTALFSAVQCCWGRLSAPLILFFCAAAALFCLEILNIFPVSPAFIYRALHVGNGVSPVVPVVFITGALLWLACSNLNRIRLFHLFPETSNAFQYDSFLHHAEQLHTDLRRIVGAWSTGNVYWLGGIALVLILSLALLNPAHIYSLETFRFEWIYSAGLYVLYLGLLVESVRFLRAWSTLQDILHMLERHALCDAFRRLPNELSPAYLWRWGGGGPRFLVLAHFLNRLKTVSDHPAFRFDHTYPEHFQQLQADAKELVGLISAVRMIEASTLRTINQHIAKVFDDLVNAMSQEWSMIHEPLAAAALAGTSPVQPLPAKAALISETKPIAEEMIALRFVELIAQVNHQLKNNLEFIAGGLILAVISLNSYPFEPHHSMTTVVTIYFFSVSIAFLLVFMQMSRNKIISFLNDTTPGKLDGNIFQLLSIGGLPFLTVISSQFPSIGGFLFAWVKPALEAIR